MFPPLEDSDTQMLDGQFSIEEITSAVKSIGAFKAPGPDGFQAIFYHTQWPIIGEDFCKMIQDMILYPNKIRDINDTFITLIPKVEMVSSMKHFRPIGLCNVSYKTITKMLSLRIRSILSNLIGP